MDQIEIKSMLLEALEKTRIHISAERADCIEELLEHGEPGIALENLCSNLHDEYIHVSREVYNLLSKSGNAMNISSVYWERIAPQDKK